MLWQFTIIRGLVETVIDNPVGWDSMTKTITRDSETHGIMFSFSESNLEFSEIAYWIIEEEYILNGVDGDVALRIECMCDTCEGFWQFYYGKLNFQTYKKRCGDDCGITVGLEASEAEILVKNRMSTSVDITSNKAYDGTTILTNYAGLGREIQLPSKALLLKSEATCTPIEGDTGYQIIGDADYDHFTNVQNKFLIPKFNNTTLDELNDFTPSPQVDFVADFQDSPIFTAASIGMIDPGAATYHIDYRVKGKIFIKWSANGSGNQSASLTIAINKSFFYGKTRRNLFFNPEVLQYSAGNGLGDHSIHTHEIPFDWSYTGDINLETGEKMWSVIPFQIIWLSGQGNPLKELRVDWDDTASYFKISNKSTTKATPANVYLIHETGSRLFEHITNGQYRFKSDYYGRTDSEPYAAAVNGCGGMRAVTNGLQIRRAKLADGSKPKVFLSPKDYFDSLNAVDCIGMGIEGNNIIFEPIKYFYSDEIIFVADGVSEINTTVRVDRIYSQFNFGYQKYETESANGLDAIHTKRQYRTSLKNTDGKIEKLSKIIADGYAIEATRRKFGTTEDWRYDQDIFMFCLSSQRSTPYTLTFTGDFVFTGFVTSTDASQVHSGDRIQITGSTANAGTYTVDFVSNFGGSGLWAIYFLEPLLQQNENGRTITVTLLDPGITVELNVIDNPANMFDPSTVINYAITPIRNAMRWFNWVVQGIRDYANTKLLFSSGEGNYVAKGRLNSGCVSEAQAVAENDPLSVSAFANADAAAPFVQPEKDAFKFPMGLNEFVDIAAKKYGKIQYRRFPAEEWKYGWIDTLRYNPNDGEAEFNLITSK